MKSQLSMETVEAVSIGRKLSIIGDELDQELMNITKRSIIISCLQQQTITDQISIAIMNHSHEQEVKYIRITINELVTMDSMSLIFFNLAESEVYHLYASSSMIWEHII
ncbi:hypothetical protein KSF78_0005916 [Schistosoma japonicum]|nr:hypothetical protein KSF78_0005916 [Schistosoma japonicum]